jgi:outer membrane biosynthesis protein TonB
MDLAAIGPRIARRWWVIVMLAGLAALGAATAATGTSEDHRTTVQFVLRPDASVSNGDLPGTLDALKSDGTLVQTVVGVLRSRSMLHRAAADANLTLGPDYSIDATVQPGSTLIETTLGGPDRAQVDRVARGYARAASNYVASSYPAYVLDPLSTTRADGSTGPGTAQLMILALLVGSALGVALVLAELRLEPQLRQLISPVADWRAARSRSAALEQEAEREPEAEPEPVTVREPAAQARREPAPEAKRPRESAAKGEPEPEAKREPEPEAKREPEPEAKREPEPEAKREPEAKGEPVREPPSDGDRRPASDAASEPNGRPKPGARSARKPGLKPTTRPPTNARSKPNGRGATPAGRNPAHSRAAPMRHKGKG